MSKKSEPVVVESVNSVEVLQAKIAAMRKAQEKFASYKYFISCCPGGLLVQNFRQPRLIQPT